MYQKRTSHTAEYVALASGLIVGGIAINAPWELITAITFAALFVLWLLNKFWG